MSVDAATIGQGGEVTVELEAPPRTGLLRELRRDKAALVGAAFLVVLVLTAIFAPLIAPHSPSENDIINRLQPPFWETGGSWTHPLGTDALGRDELSRLIYGARLSLLIATSVVLISGVVGTTLGLIAGYKGGRLDSLIMRTADTQLAFPGLLLVLLVLASFGASVPLIIGVLAFYGWMVFARLVRGIVLQLRATPAIESARMVGCSTPRILFRHLLPNVYSALLAQSMLEMARIVLAEASLSYLGLGIQPPNASWGLMVAENQDQIQDAWWTVVFPGLALSFTVIAINLVANWLRVQTDPQQRQRRFAAAILDRAWPKFGRQDSGAAAAEAVGSVLDVERLSVRFHAIEGSIDAVTDASFRIRPGETLGIVGESGSGKSTVALALLDLVPPPGRIEAADIRWMGDPVDQRELHALRGSEIAMIFQDPMTSLNPLVPVGRQVGEVLVKHKGMSSSEARHRAEELFRLVGIPSPVERLDQLPHELSGGLRQRVMIAAALASEPKLLVADEPTTALDTTIQAQILDLIVELQSRLGISMLLITHDLGVVARVCDRVAVMYAGRVVEAGPVEAIFATPRHRYTEALLAAVPRTDDESKRLATIPGRPPAGTDRPSGCPFRPRCGHADGACERMPQATVDGPSAYRCWHPAGVLPTQGAGS